MKPRMIASGKRKTAVARATLIEGKGAVIINNKNYQHLHELDKLKIEEPLAITKEILGKIDFNAIIVVKGGGEKGQIDASRLALAKAILKRTNSESLQKAFLAYDRNLLVADVRKKEAYKPGDSKARSKRQSSKR